MLLLPRPFSPRLSISLMFALSGFMYGSWAARIPGIVNQLELGSGGLGAVLPMYAVGALLAFPLAAKLISQVGSARVLASLAIARAAMFPVLAFAPSLETLGIALFLFGFTGGGADVAMNAQGVEVERQYRGTILSSLFACFSLGGLVGSAQAGLVAQMGVPIRAQFLMLGVLAIVYAVIAMRGLVPDEPSVRTIRAARRHRWRRPSLPPRVILPLGLIALCGAFADEILADWGALYLRHDLQTGAAVAGFGYTIYSLAMVCGRLFGDRLTRRLGPVVLMRAAGVCAFSGLLLAAAIEWRWTALLGFALVGLGGSVISPLAYRAAGSVPGIPRGQAVASIATIAYLGYLIGPVIVGAITGVASLRIAFVVVAVIATGIVFLARFTSPDSYAAVREEDEQAVAHGAPAVSG